MGERWWDGEKKEWEKEIEERMEKERVKKELMAKHSRRSGLFRLEHIKTL